MKSQCIKLIRLSFAALVLTWAASHLGHAQTATGATFGDVIQLAAGTPSDLVLDESRHLLYLVNNNTSLVYVLDYTTNQILTSIPVGSTPLAGAMSMDGKYLYVTSSGNTTLNVIDLNLQRVISTVTLTSKPQGVEVGKDGRVLIAMAGSGTVNGVPQGTLAVYDPTLAVGQQLQTVTQPALTSSPSTLPPTSTGTPVTTFPSKLIRTPDGNYIVGAIAPANSATYVFVYEVSSATVLRNRTVNGTSTVLAMSPDGSKFMAGFRMFDIGTLDIIGQQSPANAPFLFTTQFNQTYQVGGSTFSPDGSTIYSAFNIAATTVPATPTNSSTLFVGDAASLGVQLGIKLPESIVAKMVMLSDGSQAWGLSDSGLLHLPLGSLYSYPILAPETTQVFLAMDDCNRGLATGTLRVNNLGKGKLTFSVGSIFVGLGSTINTNAMEYQIASGVAPSTITFTMDPGRTGLTRQPGTNMFSGPQGMALNVSLASAEAINVPSVIRVYMNYRNADQRGQVFPVPTTPNNSAANGTNNGNEGLQDILLDEARNRLYITNSGYNRIEVFDTLNQKFLTPIPVMQLPHQMAMSLDGSLLYVASGGAEIIDIVDLTLQQVTGTVVFPPLPRNGQVNVVYPRSIAMGLFGLQILMSDGGQWKLSGTTAIPRPTNTVTPVALGSPTLAGMVSTSGDDYILTFSGSGIAYIYNATADTYVTGRQLMGTTTVAIQGYYGVLGAGPGGMYYLVDGLIVNPSLTTIGGSATPSSTSSTLHRNVAAVAPLDSSNFLRLTTPVRTSLTATTTDESRATLELVNVNSGSVTAIGVVPEGPALQVFGTTRTNVPARQMVVDSAGTTAYVIATSGLSVIPLASTSSATQPVITSVANSSGSTLIKPGSFITVRGQNLASTATASTTPPPNVLGGSCVTFGDIAVPLLSTSSGQIQAQVPDSLLPGTQVVEVRSLALAQDSAPVTVMVRNAAATSSAPGSPATPQRVPAHKGTGVGEPAKQ